MEMNILVMTGSISREAGGLFYSVRALSHEWAKSNNVKVLSFHDSNSASDIESWSSNILIELNRGLFGSYRLSFKMLRSILKFKPDLIYVSTIWSFPLLLAYIVVAFIQPQIKLIISPRGMVDKWAIENGNRYVKSTLLKLYVIKALKSANFVHALNSNEEISIKNVHHLINTKIIPNGVYFRENCELRKSRQVLFIGRIHPKKNIEALIEAFSMLKKTQHDLRLVIAGWGADEYVNTIKMSIQDNKNISYVGSVYGEEKDSLFLNSEMFVLPSFSEGLPMAALEAGSFGCALLLSKECNMVDFFKENIAFEIGHDASDIARQIDFYFNLDSPAQDRLRLNCRNYIRNLYSWPSLAKQMLE